MRTAPPLNYLNWTRQKVLNNVLSLFLSLLNMFAYLIRPVGCTHGNRQVPTLANLNFKGVSVFLVHPVWLVLRVLTMFFMHVRIALKGHVILQFLNCTTP